MNITKEQLPVHQFERLGISKEHVQDMPEMKNLLLGHTSKMKLLNFKDPDGVTHKVKAKLSLQQLADGSIGVRVHPFRKDIKNDMNLTQREIDKLKSGDTISKVLHRQQYLVQLDQSINELRRVKVEHVSIPERLGKVQLSMEQKNALREGKKITVSDVHGNSKELKLDLLHPKGFAEKSLRDKKLHQNQSAQEREGSKAPKLSMDKPSEYKIKR